MDSKMARAADLPLQKLAVQQRLPQRPGVCHNRTAPDAKNELPQAHVFEPHRRNMELRTSNGNRQTNPARTQLSVCSLWARLTSSQPSSAHLRQKKVLSPLWYVPAAVKPGLSALLSHHRACMPRPLFISRASAYIVCMHAEYSFADDRIPLSSHASSTCCRSALIRAESHSCTVATVACSSQL